MMMMTMIRQAIAILLLLASTATAFSPLALPPSRTSSATAAPLRATTSFDFSILADWFGKKPQIRLSGITDGCVTDVVVELERSGDPSYNDIFTDDTAMNWKKLQQCKSQYRLLQLAYNGLDVAKRRLLSLWRAVTDRGGENIIEFLQGLKLRLTTFRQDEWTSRLGACAAALLALHMTRALFRLSPILLSVLAVLFGLVWPSWWPELVARLSGFVDETRTRGRCDVTSNVNRSVSSRTSTVNSPEWGKIQYGDYIMRADGTRRYFFKWFRPTRHDVDARRKRMEHQLWPWQGRHDCNEQEGPWDWLNRFH